MGGSVGSRLSVDRQVSSQQPPDYWVTSNISCSFPLSALSFLHYLLLFCRVLYLYLSCSFSLSHSLSVSLSLSRLQLYLYIFLSALNTICSLPCQIKSKIQLTLKQVHFYMCMSVCLCVCVCVCVSECKYCVYSSLFDTCFAYMLIIYFFFN